MSQTWFVSFARVVSFSLGLSSYREGIIMTSLMVLFDVKMTFIVTKSSSIVDLSALPKDA
jgi:hypothetical protein